VERKGKNGFLFAPRQSQETCGAVSGKARVARTLLSACQAHPASSKFAKARAGQGRGIRPFERRKGGASGAKGEATAN
jgi:hypothetical protein